MCSPLKFHPRNRLNSWNAEKKSLANKEKTHELERAATATLRWKAWFVRTANCAASEKHLHQAATLSKLSSWGCTASAQRAQNINCCSTTCAFQLKNVRPKIPSTVTVLTAASAKHLLFAFLAKRGGEKTRGKNASAAIAQIVPIAHGPTIALTMLASSVRGTHTCSTALALQK
jgi:hypothetical protein